jgi:hypothetical protein
MKKKKIISIDEFFRMKEMFSGSLEDKELAFEIYKNQYKDRKILDLLMLKALMFNDRKAFAATIKVDFTVGNGKKLYTFLSLEQANEIYKQILDKLMDD